jgi:hypothetical protein
MKFIKKINEFFGQEEEIERDDIFTGDEEEGDFYFDEEEGHDEEEGDFSHEEENWGDEEDSSLGNDSRISSFDDFNSEEDDFGYATHDGSFGGDDSEDCETCDHSEEEVSDSENFGYASHDGGFEGDDSEDENEEGFQEEGFIESFKAFNEKKKIPAGLKAYLDKKAGKKSKEEDKEEDKEDKKDGKKEEKGGKGLTAAQKKLPEALRKAIEKKSKK